MLRESAAGAQASSFLGRLLSNAPLSPNHVTLLAFLFALAGFYYLAAQSFGLALLLFSLSGLCDIADGAIARARGQASAKGAFLDGVTDRVVEFLLLFGLMLYPWPAFILPGWMWVVALLFFGSAMTAFVPAYAFYRGIVVEKELNGFLPRAERMLMFLLILALLAFNLPYYASMALVLATWLSLGTFLQRVLFYWFSAK